MPGWSYFFILPVHDPNLLSRDLKKSQPFPSGLLLRPGPILPRWPSQFTQRSTYYSNAQHDLLTKKAQDAFIAWPFFVFVELVGFESCCPPLPCPSLQSLAKLGHSKRASGDRAKWGPSPGAPPGGLNEGAQLWEVELRSRPLGTQVPRHI